MPTLSRIGQNNGSGSNTALFKEKFSGEVLTAFRENCIFEPLHMVQSIENGKSAAFPATWQSSAAYHTPGNQLAGQARVQSERTILIDDMLIAHDWVAEIDELMIHYDRMSILAENQGEALAVTYDQQLAQLLVLAARASATVSGGNGGSTLANSLFGSSGTALGAGLFQAAQVLDEKRIPMKDRHAAFRPAHYYMLVQATDNINKDWGGMGAISSGTIPMIAGINIHKSNNIPNTDKSGDSTTGQNNTYIGNFATTVGAVWHKSAVGTVKLLDVQSEDAWLIDYQSTLLVSKMAVGHGILRPECAVELKTA